MVDIIEPFDTWGRHIYLVTDLINMLCKPNDKGNRERDGPKLALPSAIVRGTPKRICTTISSHQEFQHYLLTEAMGGWLLEFKEEVVHLKKRTIHVLVGVGSVSCPPGDP